jgi:hypothetical protein
MVCNHGHAPPIDDGGEKEFGALSSLVPAEPMSCRFPEKLRDRLPSTLFSLRVMCWTNWGRPACDLRWLPALRGRRASPRPGTTKPVCTGWVV